MHVESIKNGKKIFWILTVLNIALALADGLLTYIGIPDLALEGNPFVAVFGFGWGALFIANLIGLTLIAAFTYYAFVMYRQPLIPYRTYREYSSRLFFQRPDRFRHTFYWFPKNWRAAAAMTGFATGIVAPITRLIVVTEWVAHITESPWYSQYNAFRRTLRSQRFDLVVAVVLTIILYILWKIMYYRKNAKLLAKTDPAAVYPKYPVTAKAATHCCLSFRFIRRQYFSGFFNTFCILYFR